MVRSTDEVWTHAGFHRFAPHVIVQRSSSAAASHPRLSRAAGSGAAASVVDWPGVGRDRHRAVHPAGSLRLSAIDRHCGQRADYASNPPGVTGSPTLPAGVLTRQLTIERRPGRTEDRPSGVGGAFSLTRIRLVGALPRASPTPSGSRGRGSAGRTRTGRRSRLLREDGDSGPLRSGSRSRSRRPPRGHAPGRNARDGSRVG